MTPALLLALVIAAPGEPDVRPAARVERVPASNTPSNTDALARYGVGRLGIVRGQLPAAAKHLESAAKADPTALAPLRDLVAVYIDLGRDPAAIRTAKKVLVADPADSDTAHALGKLLFAAKRHAEAGDVLAAAIGSPRLATRPVKKLAMLRDLARCREMKGDATETLRTIERFLASNGDALRRAGYTPTEIDRETADATERLGRALIKRKEFDAAIAAFRTAHQLYTNPARANDSASAARLDWNLAESLRAKGDAAGALTHLIAYLDRKPAGVEPYERLAELLRQAGRGGEVVAMLKARAAADPKNVAPAWLAAIELTRADFHSGHAEVQPLLRRVNDSAFYSAMVRTYVAAGHPQELLDLLDEAFAQVRPEPNTADAADDDRLAAADRARTLAEAIAAEPAALPALLRQITGEVRVTAQRRPETIEHLAWLAERDGRLDQAERLLREAVRGPTTEKPAVPFALLKLLQQQHKWHDVIEVCDAAINTPRRQGIFFFYYFAKARAEAELARPADAFATLEPLLKRFEGRREKTRLLGLLGRYEEMAAECLVVMSEYPAVDEIHDMRFILADAYNGLRKFDQSEAELRKILEDDPDDVLALNNLGYNLADQGRKLNEAEEMVRRAIELDRDERARSGFAQTEHAAYLDSLGWVLFRKGQLAESRKLLEQAAALPDGAGDPTVWDHLGDVCFRLRDKAKAKTAWTKAAALYDNTLEGRQHGRLDEVKHKLKLAE